MVYRGVEVLEQVCVDGGEHVGERKNASPFPLEYLMALAESGGLLRRLHVYCCIVRIAGLVGRRLMKGCLVSEKLKIGVLLSGSGTNFQAILDEAEKGLPSRW